MVSSMNFPTYGLKIFAGIFFSLLTFAATSSTCLTVNCANDIQTTAYIGLSQNPIEVNKQLLVSVWLMPSIPSTQVYHGFTVEFKRPDGTIDPIGPFDSEVLGFGSSRFSYKPNQVGTWQVKFSYAGGDVIDGNTYLASSSPSQEFTVQKDPIPPWIYIELPTSYTYWGRPINSENREWAIYAGDWPQPGYNSSMNYFNPYSIAPDAPHILWAHQTGVTGLVGGKYNGTGYSGGSSVDIILAGLAYYKASDGVHCIDVHTGEELWAKPGINPSIGVAAPQHFYTAGSSLVAELWQIGDNFVKYDPYTGVETLTVPDALSGIYAEPFFYSCTNGRLITWKTDNRVADSNASLGGISNFSDLIVSNVSCGYDFDIIWDSVGVAVNRWPKESAAISLTTGETLWNRTLPVEESPVGGYSIGDGKIYVAGEGMVFRAYDLYTGDKLWTSETAVYPWGAYWANFSAVAYGKLYGLNADGHVYCFDTNTGATMWRYFSGNSSGETPSNTWGFASNPVVADGKIYVSTSERTPLEPKPIGNRLFCLNATSGEEIWKIDFAGGAKAVGDGMLLATNEYNGVLYCFGRGRTSVEVSVSPNIVTEGSKVFIEGYVLDQSPGHPGAPVVGAKDMGRWMEFLYMQRPCPTEIEGVPVQIRVIQDATGSKVDIGFAHTDLYGHFSFEWAPPVSGTYTIVGRFLGDSSYFSSWGATGLSVGKAPPLPDQSEPMLEPDYTPMFLSLIVAVAVAIGIGIVNLLMVRKQKRS